MGPASATPLRTRAIETPNATCRLPIVASSSLEKRRRGSVTPMGGRARGRSSGRRAAGANLTVNSQHGRLMDSVPSVDVTQLLKAWSNGDEHAFARLIPVIYRELRQRAHRSMRGERRGNSLQPSALINEAYLRLARSAPLTWKNRSHFFATAARMMRRIVVDHARARRSLKRGGESRLVSLEEEYLVAAEPPRDLVILDDALAALAELDARKGRVVELR